MVEVSAIAVFLMGLFVGILLGVLGIIICAFKFSKGEDKNGKENRI